MSKITSTYSPEVRDLGSYPDTDDYIAPIAAGVVDELTGYDFEETLKQRDALLVDRMRRPHPIDLMCS